MRRRGRDAETTPAALLFIRHIFMRGGGRIISTSFSGGIPTLTGSSPALHDDREASRVCWTLLLWLELYGFSGALRYIFFYAAKVHEILLKCPTSITGAKAAHVTGTTCGSTSIMTTRSQCHLRDSRRTDVSLAQHLATLTAAYTALCVLLERVRALQRARCVPLKDCTPSTAAYYHYYIYVYSNIYIIIPPGF